jgi:hypothetical protein
MDHRYYTGSSLGNLALRNSLKFYDYLLWKAWAAGSIVFVLFRFPREALWFWRSTGRMLEGGGTYVRWGGDVLETFWFDYYYVLLRDSGSPKSHDTQTYCTNSSFNPFQHEKYQFQHHLIVRKISWHIPKWLHQSPHLGDSIQKRSSIPTSKSTSHLSPSTLKPHDRQSTRNKTGYHIGPSSFRFRKIYCCPWSRHQEIPHRQRISRWWDMVGKGIGWK